MEKIPKDPVILLSYVNTKLRDFYPSLGELCAALGIEETQVTSTLQRIDYSYDEQRNQFI